jgi:GTPase SAR1 family protein
MGMGLTREKSAEFALNRRLELQSIEKKLNKVETRRILLVGPAMGGKTQLMNKLCGLPFTDQYTETETAVISHKFFNTTKSDHDRLSSISFKVFDVPGSFIKHKRAADYYFLNVHVVLIVFDMSLGIVE